MGASSTPSISRLQKVYLDQIKCGINAVLENVRANLAHWRAVNLCMRTVSVPGVVLALAYNLAFTSCRLRKPPRYIIKGLM